MSRTIEFKSLAPHVSLGDLVYQQIVEALVSGQYAGGEELNEVILAAQFHVSRTPVREALRRLAAEGLAVNQRNRQTTVVEISPSEVEQTYQVRQILETAAARMAATQISSTRLAELKGLSKAATPRSDPEWGIRERKFDEELHRAVAESCGNAKLQREIQRYNNLVRFVRSQVARSPQHLAHGHTEHLQILAALEHRDSAKAEAAMSAHIASALQVVLEELPLLARRP